MHTSKRTWQNNITLATSGSEATRLQNRVMAVGPSSIPSSMLMSRTWAPISTWAFAMLKASWTTWPHHQRVSFTIFTAFPFRWICFFFKNNNLKNNEFTSVTPQSFRPWSVWQTCATQQRYSVHRCWQSWCTGRPEMAPDLQIKIKIVTTNDNAVFFRPTVISCIRPTDYQQQADS